MPFAKGSIDVIAELDRPNAPIARSAWPLRIASGILALLFVVSIPIATGLSRAIARSATGSGFRPTQGLGQVSQASQPEATDRERQRDDSSQTRARAREEAEARRRAEDRVKLLEQQVELLQDQSRNALADVQAKERQLRETATSRGVGRTEAQLEDRLIGERGEGGHDAGSVLRRRARRPVALHPHRAANRVLGSTSKKERR